MAKKQMMKSPKAGTVTRVDHVRVSKDKPNATVKFKVVKADKEGNMTVRATMRGEKPIFIRQMDGNGVKAGVRGDSPVAAKNPAQAFDKAVRANWA